jgi:ABC-type lipoprotein release transport system permease subunit
MNSAVTFLVSHGIAMRFFAALAGQAGLVSAVLVTYPANRAAQLDYAEALSL